MKFLKFPAVLAVASCFFINSIANATVKDESELIDAKPRVKVEKKVSKPEAPAQNEKKLSKSKVDDKAKKVKLKIEEKQPKNKQVPLKVEAKLETKKAQEKVKPVKKEYFRGMELPANYKSISIFGNSVATKGQAVNLI